MSSLQMKLEGLKIQIKTTKQYCLEMLFITLNNVAPILL